MTEKALTVIEKEAFRVTLDDLSYHTLPNGAELSVHIYQDAMDESPREWDNLGTMVCFHNRYNLGDQDTDFHTVESVRSYLKRNLDKLIALPVYIYEHSGIALSTAPYICPWDSGQVGVVFVEKSKVREEFGVQRISAKLAKQVRKILDAEVQTYNQYVNNDVWGYTAEVTREVETCEHCGKTEPVADFYDGCGGFYDAKHMLEELNAALDAEGLNVEVEVY